MTNLDPERLLGEARWMRALARELAGGAGEDVVQEAFVVALERPEAGRNVGAWLAGVVRNLARRTRRAEASRPRRERAAARAEALPATDELVAEGELQKELVAAVMRLEEPYRATVLLHYFRGLALVEIARAQGVPDATVRTRVRRALVQLRAELDGRCGGREAWACVALGLEPGVALGGGVLVGTKTMVALAGAAGVLALVAWRAQRKLDEPELATASPATVGIEPGPAVTEAGPPGRGLDVVEEIEERSPLPSAPVTEVLLHGTAHDREGREVEVWASAEDEWAEVVRMDEATLGTWSLAGLHPGRWTLRVGGEGLARVTRELVLAEPVETLALVFERASPIRVRVLDENGSAIEPGSLPLMLLISREPPVSGQLGVRGDANEFFGAGRVAMWSPNPPDSQVPPGFFGLVRPAVAPPFHVSLVSHGDVLETRRIDGPVEEMNFEVARAALQARTGSVSVRYIDGATGAPLADVHAFVTYFGFNVVRPQGGPTSGQDGRVRIAHPTPGVWMLHSLCEGRAYTTQAVRVTAGETTDVGDVLLWPKAKVTTRALDPDGQARSVWLQWLPVGKSPLDIQGVNYGAQYASNLMPATRFWLLVVAEGFARQCVLVDASSGHVDGLELRLVRGQRVLLRHGTQDIGRQVSIVTAEGGPIDSWSLGSRSLALSLAPGAYELWTGVGERVDERTPFVVGDEPVRLEVPPAKE